jgi:hypothetical protein
MFAGWMRIPGAWMSGNWEFTACLNNMRKGDRILNSEGLESNRNVFNGNSMNGRD